VKWHSYAEEHPLLKDSDPLAWERFKTGIKKTGGCKDDPVKYRLLDNGLMQGLDGRNRYLACKELRLKCDMRKVNVPDDQVEDYIDRKNRHRRHEPREVVEKRAAERRERVAAARAEGKSIRAIAAQEGFSPKTIQRDIERTGATVSGDTVEGLDGKNRPATRNFGDAYEGAVLCRRCTRMGQETPASGCPKCEAERNKAQRKKAERETSKRKQGDPVFDVKQFNDAFGHWLRQIDKIGRPFKANNSKEAEAFRDEIEATKKRILEWQRSLANGATTR
jgi:hypothetical protein